MKTADGEELALSQRPEGIPVRRNKKGSAEEAQAEDIAQAAREKLLSQAPEGKDVKGFEDLFPIDPSPDAIAMPEALVLEMVTDGSRIPEGWSPEYMWQLCLRFSDCQQLSSDFAVTYHCFP